MGLGKFIGDVKRTITFRKRKAPKTSSGLPVAAGELPEDPQRLVLCRLAFEAGLEKMAKDYDFAWDLLRMEDTVITGILWPALAPLTKAERRSVVWRTREFAKARISSGQNS